MLLQQIIFRPPQCIFFPYAMPAGPVSHTDCFFLIFEKYPVLRQHPFPRTAMEAAINLILFIPRHFYFP